MQGNRSALAVGFAVLVHVSSAPCVLYHLNRFRHFVQLGDFEQHSALAASYPTVGGAAVE